MYNSKQVPNKHYGLQFASITKAAVYTISYLSSYIRGVCIKITITPGQIELSEFHIHLETVLKWL